MSSDSAVAAPSTSFSQRLNGRYNGIIRMADAWHLAAAVATYNEWYIVDPANQDRLRSVDGSDAGCYLEELLEEILREEKGVWSTLLYVQEISDPQIIKIFHPRRAGCGCGGQGGIVPWRVLTRIKPDSVPQWQQESCEVQTPETGFSGFSWLKKLF
ncbi:MAG: hypothetical protein HQL68_07445 [Magnetococcales bacterium]|nr:hypothetical protein [Magnetococcales bacterium]